MSAPPSSAALFTARCLVDELERGGLSEACLAPGSRSTPLALALAERPSIRTHVITDERSLAFFALGIAKASPVGLRMPTLIVCTSGTAAANFLPAVVEASLAELPLLVLTADRPAELRDCASPQTIDQVGLYGSHTRWAVDVPILGLDADAEHYYRALARRALATTVAEHAGPVHLNLPFREPFWDDTFRAAERAEPQQIHAIGDPAEAGSLGPCLRSPSRLDEAQTRAVASLLLGARKGLLVCAGRELPAADIVALARALQWPILADPLSGLRCGSHDRSLVVDAYDVLLRDAEFRREHRPDLILRFGTTPAPRSLQTFLQESRPCEHLLVAPSGWPDPFHAATTVLAADAATLCRDLLAALPVAADAGAWTRGWLEASTAARSMLDRQLDAASAKPGPAFEGGILRTIIGALPSPATLFVGNSMPIRDADAFFGQSAGQLRLLANRGASGIDGVLSTALGVAAASEQPTVLVLGDLSFLHDLTALTVAARYRMPLVTVVINNDGGGIFSFLPQHDLGAVFETFFATPHGVDLGAAASALLPGAYALAAGSAELASLVTDAVAAARPCVIEVRSDRASTPGLSRALVASAQRAASEAR